MLFLIHILEEYIKGFVYIDRVFLWASQPFQWASPIMLFTVFQIILWASMIQLYFYAKKKKKMKEYLWIIIAIIIFETHHIIEAIIIQAYYPGLFTAIAIVTGGLFLLTKKK